MNPIIKSHPNITFIGNRQTMTFSQDKTFLLWNSFMPRRNEITNRLGEELYNVVIYPNDFDFNPTTPFEKWATAPVTNKTIVPPGMEILTIPEGLYAVFLYKGINTEAESFFKAIFTEWLPASGYQLDNRPHFEILGNKYKHNDPSSEEEVWIPINS